MSLCEETRRLREEFVGKTPIRSVERVEEVHYDERVVLRFSTTRIPVTRDGERYLLGPYTGEVWHDDKYRETYLCLETRNPRCQAAHPHDDDCDGRVCLGNNWDLMGELYTNGDWSGLLHLILLHIGQPTYYSETTPLWCWGGTPPMEVMREQAAALSYCWVDQLIPLDRGDFVGLGLRPGKHIEREYYTSDTLGSPYAPAGAKFVLTRNTRTKMGKITVVDKHNEVWSEWIFDSEECCWRKIGSD